MDWVNIWLIIRIIKKYIKFTRRKDLELGNFYSEINEGLVLEKYKNENLEEYLKAYVNTGLVSFEESLYNFI